jgi:corrinoid protein of di/trimethylamine methyltransferase
MSKELFDAMRQSIIDGDPELAAELAQKAVELGIDPIEVLNQGFVPGVSYVGEQFGLGEMFLPELVVAGEAMKAAVAVLEPEFTRRGTERQILGRVVIGTIEGDIHEIGKSLVATMLSASGFQVYDMGVDVPIMTFIEKAREVKADIIGISALLTTTMVRQKDVIEALEDNGMRGQVKVMVGGAPVTQSWAKEIGADGYSEDAVGAVVIAKTMMGAA